jgi:hypothetical protein
MEKTEVQTDLALFYKEGKYALLALNTNNEMGALLRFDPRDEQPTIVVFDNPFTALEKFDRSIDKSVQSGWKCFHKGKPNWG